MTLRFGFVAGSYLIICATIWQPEGFWAGMRTQMSKIIPLLFGQKFPRVTNAVAKVITEHALTANSTVIG
jgi:hypothetical protein